MGIFGYVETAGGTMDWANVVFCGMESMLGFEDRRS